MTAFAVLYRNRLRAVATRSRLATGVLFAGLGLAIGLAGGDGDQSALNAADGLGLAIVVPVVSLLFATAVLGDTIEDRTLVYLWLRPIPRWKPVLASCAAVATVAWPLTVPTVTVSVALAGADADLIGATMLATTLALVAYVPLWVALGLVVDRALVVGVAWVLLWEGAVAPSSDLASRVSVRAYAQAVLIDAGGADLDTPVGGTPAALVAAAVAATLAIAVGWWRLQTRDVA